MMKRADLKLVEQIFTQTETVYGKQTALDAMQQEVKDIEDKNGQPNVLEGVQANGIDLEVDSDKKVNVIVPTNISELINDDNYQTYSDVAAAVAAVVAEAPEAYDTLKEIADWIENHSSSAAEMNSAISELQTLIGQLPDTASAKTIVSYITEVIESVVGDYITEDDFEGFTDDEIAEAYAAAVVNAKGA